MADNVSQFLAPVPFSFPGNNSLVHEAVSPPIDVEGFDYHTYIEDLNLVRSHWTDDGAYLPTTITNALAFIVGITGNSLVVFALLCDTKARNVTASFLVSLAVADLVFLLICVPYNMAEMFTTIWKGGLVLCKLTGFVEMLSASASVLNLTAVSVERYVVIVHPMKSRSWCTMGNTKKIIGGVWVVAVLLSSPMLYIMDTTVGLYYNNETYYITSMCVTTNSMSQNDRILFSWYQMLVMFLLPTTVMVFCYAFVIHVLWISTKELARMTHTPRAEDIRLANVRGGNATAGGRFNKPRFTHSPAVRDHSAEVREARKQVIRMLLTIIAIFFMSWGPRLVYNVIKQHGSTIHTVPAFYASVVIKLLPYVQSCSNPVIYSFMSNNFRRSMRLSCDNVCHHHPTERECCCRGHRRRARNMPDYDMDTKSANGTSYLTQSRGYSPPMTSRCGGRTYASVVSEF